VLGLLVCFAKLLRDNVGLIKSDVELTLHFLARAQRDVEKASFVLE